MKISLTIVLQYNLAMKVDIGYLNKILNEVTELLFLSFHS